MNGVLIAFLAGDAVQLSRILKAERGNTSIVVIEVRPKETPAPPQGRILEMAAHYSNATCITIPKPDRETDWPNIRAGFAAFLNFLYPPNNEPNPLPILMRALNAPRLHGRAIKQPCWRRGRWKSLT